MEYDLVAVYKDIETNCRKPIRGACYLSRLECYEATKRFVQRFNLSCSDYELTMLKIAKEYGV